MKDARKWCVVGQWSEGVGLGYHIIWELVSEGSQGPFLVKFTDERKLVAD